jgi:hypothetical protein
MTNNHVDLILTGSHPVYMNTALKAERSDAAILGDRMKGSSRETPESAGKAVPGYLFTA